MIGGPTLFSKRHFEMIAAAMEECYKWQATPDEKKMWERILDELCAVFEVTNARFNRVRFRDACRGKLK